MVQTSAHRTVDMIMDCFRGRWSFAFFAALFDGPKHETAIAKVLNVRYRLLHNTAKGLAANKLIWHEQSKGSKTFYLTDKGRELSKTLLALGDWGDKWL